MEVLCLFHQTLFYIQEIQIQRLLLLAHSGLSHMHLYKGLTCMGAVEFLGCPGPRRVVKTSCHILKGAQEQLRRDLYVPLVNVSGNIC